MGGNFSMGTITVAKLIDQLEEIKKQAGPDTSVYLQYSAIPVDNIAQVKGVCLSEYIPNHNKIAVLVIER